MWRKAMSRLCLLLLLLLHATTPEPQPQYLLLVPSLLRGMEAQKICILFTHLNETLSLKLMLEYKQENTTLIQETVSDTDLYRCQNVQLPRPVAPEVVYVTLEAKGETLHLTGKKSFLLQSPESLVFVQTDKPIYKPGQDVQFRIVALDEDFHPVNETFHEVFIEDARQNRIAQWRNVSTDHGIAQLSLRLVSEPLLGTYKVGVQRAQGSRVDHPFSVEEYVLPKYEVVVKVPPTITVLDQELPVSVCGVYTYRKPVPGLINVTVCRKFQQSSYGSSCQSEEYDAVCEKYSRKADGNGCFSEVVNTKLFQMKRSGYEMKLRVAASITEEGTDLVLSGEGTSGISSTIAKVSFQEVDAHFKRGIPLYGQVRLEDAAGNPIENETVTIYMDFKTNVSVTTDEDGKASFSMDTTHVQESYINLRATYKSFPTCYRHNWIQPSYEDANQQVKQFYSYSQSFLKIQPVHHPLPCEHQEELTVHYVLSPEGLKQATEAVIHYLVMAKGSIVWTGKHTVSVGENSGTSMTTSLLLPVSSKIAPLARLLVFTVLPSGETIADTVTLKIAKCFTNRVSLQFSVAEGLPGSSASLLLEATPHSLCAVRAVDKSVLLMKPEAELSADSMYSLLPLENLSGYNHGGFYLEESQEEICLPTERIYLNGFYYQAVDSRDEADSYDIFKDLGLKFFTNSRIKKPRLCARRVEYYNEMVSFDAVSERRMHAAPAAALMIDAPTQTRGMQETVRKYFPETWLWWLVPVGTSGNAEATVTIPDAITEWKAGTFCTAASTGFGLSPTISLTAFQPFFLELTLPYSCIRGEDFVLTGTVFNYLHHGLRVGVALKKSDNFQAELMEEEEEDAYCVPADGRRSWSWTVTMKTLGESTFELSAETVQGEGLCGNEVVTVPEQGRRDTVIKTLLVEPEGVEKDATHTSLLCVTGDSISEKVSLRVPENIVEGSAWAYVSILGDLLGSALRNLHKLLKLPVGCGEQNMVLFTPNIFLMEYLNNTGQLTEAIHSKALGYLASGYQQQLLYKHMDGSYSAFGPRWGTGQGNTWLTTFVLKSFARAQPHVYISERHLSEALLWLSHRQQNDGCFLSVGQLFNNAMKGGVDDKLSLSAYVTITMLEYPLPITHPLVRNALFCLKSALKTVKSIYSKALMSYAFTLAGSEEERQELLESLMAEAVIEKDSVHWRRPGKPEKEETEPFLPQRAPSAEVEMASYVLLSLLSGPHVSEEQLVLCSKIVKWIVHQQGPSGGFSSTQDTVVALQALSLFGTHTYRKNSASTVTLRSESDFQTQYHVDDANRLLLQQERLPDVPGDYSVEVKGDGCVFLQMTVKYNQLPPKGDAPFTLHVTTIPSTCTADSQQRFLVFVNTSYVGPRLSSNMAIVEVKLPSGFFPDKASVKRLLHLPWIKRAESKPNHVNIYLDQLTNRTLSFQFSAERDMVVSNLKPAVVKVYDYYEIDEFALAEYSAPCSTESPKGISR
ncbi:alpha-2-macroglobulin isoform X2 [Rhinatrema bivittatum]|uniref:alpha-2-macroglobulin isoform X2 n=1 Tax=Rhinatrema bivittatum TaxID=194408 RepID=UPI001127CE59|nr:alpha-2-macroglobulin isoform X2 [Rhinatrema bivittatum]